MTNDQIPVILEGKAEKVKGCSGSGGIVYSWRIGRGIYLSNARRVVVDTYLETRNYVRCVERLREECNKEISVSTVKMWLKKDDIRAYIYERMEEEGIYNGWTKWHWFLVMTGHLEANARYEAAKDEVKINEEILRRDSGDEIAKGRIERGIVEMREARMKRLGNGDLYAMKLIGQYKGWEMQPMMSNITQVNITQASGRE